MIYARAEKAPSPHNNHPACVKMRAGNLSGVRPGNVRMCLAQQAAKALYPQQLLGALRILVYLTQRTYSVPHQCSFGAVIWHLIVIRPKLTDP